MKCHVWAEENPLRVQLPEIKLGTVLFVGTYLAEPHQQATAIHGVLHYY